jgi:hypothetical protein
MKKISVLLIVLLALLIATSAALADDGGAPRTTSLTGAEEVNGGDPDGSGWAMITLNHGQGMVCWEIAFEGIDAPFAAHIHRAVAGVNGPVVVPTFNPSINSGCGAVDPDLIKDIIQNPENYYVNVHNAAFPGGALRGQLSVPGQSD